MVRYCFRVFVDTVSLKRKCYVEISRYIYLSDKVKFSFIFQKQNSVFWPVSQTNVYDFSIFLFVILQLFLIKCWLIIDYCGMGYISCARVDCILFYFLFDFELHIVKVSLIYCRYMFFDINSYPPTFYFIEILFNFDNPFGCYLLPALPKWRWMITWFMRFYPFTPYLLSLKDPKFMICYPKTPNFIFSHPKDPSF